MDKEEKKKAIKEVVANATSAIAEIIKDVDYKDADELIKTGFQVEAIKRCALAQAQVIASQPNIRKFENGGVVSVGEDSQGFVININRDGCGLNISGPGCVIDYCVIAGIQYGDLAIVNAAAI